MTQNSPVQRSLRHQQIARFRGNLGLYAMLLLPVVIVIIFRYLPIFGTMIAFKKYDFTKGILGSDWVGLRWFEKFLTNRKFGSIFGNTITLSVSYLLISFPFPILLALSLNELIFPRFKRVIQTFSYMPYFISTVVVIGMMNQLLSPTTGVVNALITRLGGKAINFVSEPGWFRPMYIISGIWSTMGYNSILYMSALSSISMELYEAADMDGAGRFGKIWHVTLPGILPTVLILFLMNLGTVLNIGYEKAFLMQNALNLGRSEIIGTYVYKQGLVSLNYDYAAAIGLFQSTLNLILIVLANTISRKVADISLW